MAVVIRFVNGKGCVVEHFIGLVHVPETTSVTLKKAIDDLFIMNGLSTTRLRGQGYDGGSNMRGEFNGLKSLILSENKSAFYVHCFAHQLQLALVYVAKNHDGMALFFHHLSSVVNIAGASCKRRDILREKRAGDTRWGSHYGSLINLILMFTSVVEHVAEDAMYKDQRGEALALLDGMQHFEFALCLHLMKNILGITNDLSKALQRKDQDIVNAMALVKIAKERMQLMRDNGWDPLLIQVSLFCTEHNIDIPKMEEKYITRGRSRRRAEEITNRYYYKIGVAYTCIDMQIRELNERFRETKSELLMCMACLSPNNSFSSYDKDKLIQLVKLYPTDSTKIDIIILDDQLENYVLDVRSDSDFFEVDGISGLAMKMIQKRKHIVYPLVYKLITLSLTLPVATATVESTFSAMHIVKNVRRNQMGDECANDWLITYIEKKCI